MGVKNKNITRVCNKDGGIVRDMFGFSLFGSNRRVLLSMILSDIEKKRKIWIATVNPEFVMETKKDKEFFEILKNKTSYNVIDGIGLAWAIALSKKSQITKNNFQNLCNGFRVGVEILMGQHREKLITGADLMTDLCAMAEKTGRTVFFYGGWDDRSKKTAQYFLKNYPKLKIEGAQAENFDFDQKIDCLFVARGMKKQEEWIEANFDKLKVGLVMGVGRSFDYYSGNLPRAPKWVQKIGFEWLFSLIMEPKRWKRQLVLPQFIWMVLKSP